jgi:FMN phosphatase YigB (HAD superfamily)
VRRYRALLVDLDGTLYHHPPVRLAMIAEVSIIGGFKKGRIIKYFRHQHSRLRDENDGGERDPYAMQIERTARHFGMEPAAVRALIEEWMILRPAKYISRFKRRRLIADIGRFRAAGGAVVVVSDYPARAKLDAIGLLNGVDGIVANGETDGLIRLKPSPDGYLRAAAMVQAQPSECLVVGDRRDLDGEAARAAGMEFLHVGTFKPIRLNLLRTGS